MLWYVNSLVVSVYEIIEFVYFRSKISFEISKNLMNVDLNRDVI